ncbi:MAG: acyl-CoA thioesterase [Selenomonadaceae bacterium]|nr:acyl-CoA thioesterase [Selenomonadaceae bacterium]MBQ6132106.1 acyl-CoA thioesterase [Selenomonadaceae bacterium]
MIVTTTYRVKFYDTDTFRIVHHSNYIRWFETGRVEFLRELGIDLNEMMNDGILFPIVEIGAKFHAPAKFDDVLEIETTAEALTKAKMKFNYVIRKRGEEKILAEGTSTNVFTHDGKICRLPDKYFSKIVKGQS